MMWFSNVLCRCPSALFNTVAAMSPIFGCCAARMCKCTMEYPCRSFVSSALVWYSSVTSFISSKCPILHLHTACR
ncbi:hypothetical protein PF005_g31897 [Phytophthora fragariae]|uniref:Secreted protein n=2 Tax=Phytophthora fragariae TaxID=53985 RepID=A0A6A3V2Q4_9STRA|nr:hypothetical protein PF003_g27369 [Phytophthora fragariae]KAE9158644.1 hypothetical protein PF004_g31808 [Phytophthora fragariae]KAE9159831.1 hypothetical protein PF005_g31897 [Phytophthora fragariae]KAE9263270.1 hypothetical protein PF008_g32402 [Phytophthora fragariae]